MPLNLQKILRPPKPTLPLTKMVCTMGPSCNSKEAMLSLINSGMAVARFNFSHGTHQSHADMLRTLRSASESPGVYWPPATMLDTKGPEIRTGDLADPTQKAVLKKGQQIKLTTDYSVKSSSEVISFSYPDLYSDLHVGSRILVADGNLSLRVVAKDDSSRTLVATVLNDFELGAKKNVNLPGVAVKLPVLSPTDRDDLIHFGLKHKMDMVALSFTTSEESVRICRDVLGEAGKDMQIIAKIENQQGLSNLEGILRSADGIMIARGDLGMEMDLQKMFAAQAYMTEMARKHHKVAIVATQMLESMVHHPRPTRAEMTDVGHAVWSMADATMLSGETGGGLYPLLAAQTMRQITLETLANFPFQEKFKDLEERVGQKDAPNKIDDPLVRKVAGQFLKDPVDAISVTEGGAESVVALSRLGLGVPIFWGVSSATEAQRYRLHHGIYTYIKGTPFPPATGTTKADEPEKENGLGGTLPWEIGNQPYKILMVEAEKMWVKVMNGRSP